MISENVIQQIIKEERKNYDSIRKILKDVIAIEDEGVDIQIELRVKVMNSLPQDLLNFKSMIEKSIIENTGLQVREMKIDIKGIDFS